MRYSPKCFCSRTTGAESAKRFRVPHVSLSRQMLIKESGSPGEKPSRGVLVVSFAGIVLISHSRVEAMFLVACFRVNLCQTSDYRDTALEPSVPPALAAPHEPDRRCARLPAPATRCYCAGPTWSGTAALTPGCLRFREFC